MRACRVTRRSPRARAEEEARLRRLFSEPGSASEVTDPGPRVDRLAGIPTLDEIRVQIEQARQKIDALREAVRKRR